MKCSRFARVLLTLIFTAVPAVFSLIILASPTIPTDIQLPGTQQLETAGYAAPENCDNCHGGTTNPDFEPDFGWRGGMMANASRDPIFWATMAIAEQDFLPNTDPDMRGGAGDLCLRCHTVNGWMGGRSTPTDGSGMDSRTDTNGVECEFCHFMVDPDEPTNIPGTVEEQNAPFEAFDPDTGEAYRGAAEYVINSEGTRLGPYSDALASHTFHQSPFHRKAEFCATCHDVSNPAVGDLAHNYGAQIDIDPADASGILGTPVDTKAAFNNFPHQFGITERTYSEYVAGALDTTLVNDFVSLPAELRVSEGSFYINYHRAYDARSDANYEDGTPRYFTCQTCHMSASTGVGCNKNNMPIRTDLPRHDQTGSGYWIPDAIQYQDLNGTLRFGTGLTQKQHDALDAGQLRAQELIQSAASVEAWQDSGSSALTVKVTNLTGHKFISGYPEGRRAWINIKWLDAGSEVIAENGAYGDIGRTVNDLVGTPHNVKSLIDPSSTIVYEVLMAMDQEWANQLITLGYDANLALTYDRMTDSVAQTLGDLALEPVGTAYHTFHFVLNNTVEHDNRIPPYGFKYDEAMVRNCLPVPADQFGSPGAGGTYNHYDEVDFEIPDGAVAAQVRLYYQPTSWEYIQFLWKANDGASAFLGQEGINMLDAWLNTGQAAPLQIDLAVANNLVSGVSDPPGETSHQNVSAEQMTVTYDRGLNEITLNYTPACSSNANTVYYGDIASIATYGYTGAQCYADISGSAVLTGSPDNIFFVIAGNNGVEEGSYGDDSTGTERPEATGIGACDLPQNLTGTCDPIAK